MADPRAILITGCSTGIGRETARISGAHSTTNCVDHRIVILQVLADGTQGFGSAEVSTERHDEVGHLEIANNPVFLAGEIAPFPAGIV